LARRFLAGLALSLAATAAFAQPVNFTGDYTQNFDGMGATGLTLPGGWTCGAAANPVKQVNCVVTVLPGGAGLITLSVPGGTINPGSSFSVCVTQPNFPRPVITNISPRTGGRGTIFTVTGGGFGSRPGDNCFMFGREDGSLPDLRYAGRAPHQPRGLRRRWDRAVDAREQRCDRH